jgi:hypothetical protein
MAGFFTMYSKPILPENDTIKGCIPLGKYVFLEVSIAFTAGRKQVYKIHFPLRSNYGFVPSQKN